MLQVMIRDRCLLSALWRFLQSVVGGSIVNEFLGHMLKQNDDRHNVINAYAHTPHL